MSVLLRDKALLTPELPDKAGLIYAKNTFNLEEFEVELDISIHNKISSSFARGDFRLFLLRDNPMMKPRDFGHGLDDQFNGVQIHIKEGSEPNPDKSKDAPKRLHQVFGQVRDEQYFDMQ